MAQETSAISQEVVSMQRLWRLYEEAVLPVERKSFYHHFHAPPVTPEEFEARPQVLLVGQYSTGKTSIVKWLTGVDSPHFDVRPQPSTDKFMAVVHGPEERLIQGNAATCLPQLPYQGLASFGAGLLGSFQALATPCDILQRITLVDTPGVLSGSKQRIGRNYDFAAAAAWMADRADLVLLTFDAHKLDISDEFQEVMEVLRPYAAKVRCVLNKADQIDSTNLVRVYGALLWNVGKVLRTPEVARVFVSSFWDEQYRYTDHKQLFEEDKKAVMQELDDLPKTALLRKVNDFVARVRRVKAHMCVLSHIQSQLPWLSSFGSEARVRKWLEGRLPALVEEAQKTRGLSQGDMPDVEALRERLCTFDAIGKLPAWDAKTIANLDRVITQDVPKLLADVGGVTGVGAGCRELRPPKEPKSLFKDLFTTSESRKRQRTGGA